MSLEEDPSNRESRLAVELEAGGAPALVRWSTIWRPGRYSPFDSYALRTPQGWILIDPEAPESRVEAQLHALLGAPPVATVLTSDGHERACYEARERWGTPVWGPRSLPSARGVAYEGRPDHYYEEDTTLPGDLRALRVAGAWGGDHMLRWRAPGGERVLFSGDLLNGQVELGLAPAEHYRRAPGLYCGSRPGYAERHPAPAALKASLSRLLAEEVDLVCGSHGTPFRGDVAGAIGALLSAI